MVLVFDVYADLAMFRENLIPPPPWFPFLPAANSSGWPYRGYCRAGSRRGAGAWRADYWRHFSGSRIALSLKKPPSWMTTTVNLIKYKSPSGDMREHIQAKHQLLKKPIYRIYFNGGELYPELKKRLMRNEFVFTPYLGAAWALAEIDFCGEFAAEEIVEVESGGVDTVVPMLEGGKDRCFAQRRHSPGAGPFPAG